MLLVRTRRVPINSTLRASALSISANERMECLTTSLRKDEVACPKPYCKQKCLSVSHKGVVYQCVKAMREHTGISIHAIYQALSKDGSTERCGEPRGGRMGNVRPITIGKYSWPSVSAMAREIGVERSTITKQLKRSPQKALASVMLWEREKEIKNE